MGRLPAELIDDLRGLAPVGIDQTPFNREVCAILALPSASEEIIREFGAEKLMSMGQILPPKSVPKPLRIKTGTKSRESREIESQLLRRRMEKWKKGNHPRTHSQVV